MERGRAINVVIASTIKKQRNDGLRDFGIPLVGTFQFFRFPKYRPRYYSLIARSVLSLSLVRSQNVKA